MTPQLSEQLSSQMDDVRARLTQPEKWDLSFHTDGDSRWWRAVLHNGTPHLQIDRGEVESLIQVVNCIHVS